MAKDRTQTAPQSSANAAGWSSEVDPNPGTKPNATLPEPSHANPDTIEHQQIKPVDEPGVGGRDESQVKAPTVSLHPTSEPQGDNSEENDEVEYEIIDLPFVRITADEKSTVQNLKYPLEELEIDQGMYIPVGNSTTDKLMSEMHKMVDQYRKQNSEVEKDEDGDDVMEDVAINKKQRNDDGTVKLDGDTPRLGIKSGFRPKLIGPNFTVKAVVKGDQIADDFEAPHDGVLVVRMD